MVNHGALIWFRDRESALLLVEAFADKYGYDELGYTEEGAVRKYEGMTKSEFFEFALTRLFRQAIIDYRRANAEKASVTAELPELPDVS
jgi:hypothetical protein